MSKIKIKSVSEVAKELNISRQAVHQKLKQLPSNLTPKKVNGAYQLTPDIVDFISGNTSSTNSVNQVDNQPIDKEVDGIIEVLTELKRQNEKLHQQLEVKDKQIEAKDKQLADQKELLSDLTRLVDQQQQLTLRTDNKNEKLEIELKSLKEEKEIIIEETQAEEKRDDEIIIEETQAIKRWWQFFK